MPYQPPSPNWLSEQIARKGEIASEMEALGIEARVAAFAASHVVDYPRAPDHGLNRDFATLEASKLAAQAPEAIRVWNASKARVAA